jgi:FlaA1/EpsC-like NDP-sugar epimerase
MCTNQKTILVFGGTGCLGRTLIKKYLDKNNKYKIVNFSRDEHKHWEFDKELEIDYPNQK